jgi:hypothetical protein
MVSRGVIAKFAVSLVIACIILLITCIYGLVRIDISMGVAHDVSQLPLGSDLLTGLPAQGTIAYALRDYFGGESMLFSGSMPSRELDRFCVEGAWFVISGHDRSAMWLEKQREYKADPSVFPVISATDVLFIDKPVEDGMRVMIYYMPSSERFTGEVILFR